MAIFYLDYENGNDAARSSVNIISSDNNGSGLVRILTAANHGLVTGAKVTIAGHSVSEYNGDWVITNIDATHFDLQNSTYSSSGTGGTETPFGGMNWADAWKTITNGATAARIAPGDIIRIAKSPAPVSIGRASWTNLSKTVVLENAQTLNVDMCENVWTGVNDTTVTRISVSTDAKEGSYCMKLALDSSPQTNKLQAYYKISDDGINFSAYQKLSFWIKNSAAIVANNWYVALCSDTAGATVIDTFKIPAIPSTGRWIPVTLAREGSGNLGNAIKSIAVYTGSTAPTASSYILIDDFIACTTNGLNLQSLISKNSNEQGGTEGWYCIKNINGTTILLDNDTNSKANEGRGYYGTTETVTTYKRETIKTAMAGSSSTAIQEVQDSGTSGSKIEFQGGFNTSNNNQDGETFFDGLNGWGYGIYLNGKSYTILNYLNVCRYHNGIYYYGSSNNNTITTLSNANNNSSCGVYYNSSNNNTITTLGNVNNNSVYGVYYNSSNNNTITTLSNANNNSGYGVDYSYSSNNNTIKSLSTSGNSTGGVYNNTGVNYLFNAKIQEATEVAGFTNFANSRIFSQNHDQIADNHWIFTDGGTIHSQTAVRHTASGIAWQLSPTSTNRSSNYPLDLSVAKVAVEANKAVSIKAWMRRSNTELTMRLIVKGKQIAGVDNDIYADLTADANIWQEVSLSSFTPTEKGVIEVMVYAWGGTNYNGFIDDLTISQS